MRAAPVAQSVYKTYIDVVHIQKDESATLYSLFSEDSETQAAAQARARGRGWQSLKQTAAAPSCPAAWLPRSGLTQFSTR